MRSIFENSTFKFGKHIMAECIDSTHDYDFFSSRKVQWVGQKELHMCMYDFDTYLTVFCSSECEETTASCLEYKELTFGDMLKP